EVGRPDRLLEGGSSWWARAGSTIWAYTRMFTVIVLVGVGTLLGAFLSFPAFALTAITCSILYSLYSFDGTLMGYVASVLRAIIALQFGYFIAVAAIVLRRRGQLARRDDQ